MEGNSYALFDLFFLLLIIGFIFRSFFGKKMPKDDKKNPRKVVTFPNKVTVQGGSPARQAKKVHRHLAEIEKLQGVAKIAAFDPSFNDKAFLAGAVRAYEWLHKAVEDKDIETIENMTSPRLTEQLVDGIEAGETPLMPFKRVDDAHIIECRVSGRTAILDVRYDAVHLGDGGKEKSQSFIWTWARSVDEADPNWELESINALT